MKRILLIIITACLIIQSKAQQTNTFPKTGSAGIGTTKPDTSALLEMASITKGLLIPRMTQAQRNAIYKPATGLMIYQTTNPKGFFFYDSAKWSLINAVSGLNNSNVFIGLSAGKSNTTGFGNIAIGKGSLQNNTEGNGLVAIGDSALFNQSDNANNYYYNTAVGSKTLYSNMTGSANTAVGYSALYSNTSGVHNCANGFEALFNNTTGVNNTATGQNALLYNTTGNFNTANGYGALAYSTTASNNTGTGDDALLNNATGNNNTANGAYALFSNTTGYSNVAIGVSALYKSVQEHNLVAVGDSALFNQSQNVWNGYGSSANTAVGSKALYFNTGGSGNTANGYLALFHNDGGGGNTANGLDALYNNIGGNYNTALGEFADVSSGSLSNAMALGYAATVNASNKVVVGNTSANVIGGQVGWSTFSDGRFKKDIQQNVPGLSFINKLKPVTYHAELEKFEQFLGRKDSTLQAMKPELQKAEQKLRTGFIAQDVEKATKEINYDFDGVNHPQNDKDNYSLVYADFVPSLVKAVQELSAENNELKKRLEKLEDIVSKQSIANSATHDKTINIAYTMNTYPNPVKDILNIESEIKATFNLSDASGKIVLDKQINHNGSIDVSKLPAGLYFLRNDTNREVQKIMIEK